MSIASLLNGFGYANKMWILMASADGSINAIKFILRRDIYYIT